MYRPETAVDCRYFWKVTLLGLVHTERYVAKFNFDAFEPAYYWWDAGHNELTLCGLHLPIVGIHRWYLC